MFTVPSQIEVIAFQNQTVVYDILFRAASETLRTIAADPEHLGAEIGFLGVLHTWGQALTHHPHIHFLVPGGGIAPNGRSWIACRPGFFLPVEVLLRMFRGLFLRCLEKAFAAGELNFFSEHRHLHEPAAFRRYLTPAWLPDGFHRIRYFGFLGNCHRAQKLQRCRELLGMAPAGPGADPPVDYRDRFEALIGQSLRVCPHCHTGTMVVISTASRGRKSASRFRIRHDALSPVQLCDAKPPTRSEWKRSGCDDRERLRTRTKRPNPAYAGRSKPQSAV